MNYLVEKYKDKYRKMIKEEQTKDLVSLLLQGYSTSAASEIVCIANTFNCMIDVASNLYEEQ